MNATSAAAPISGADDGRRLALGRQRRRERALAPVAAGRARLPRRRRSGATSQPSAGPTRPSPTATFASAGGRRLDPRRPRDRFPLGRRPARATPGRPAPTTTSTAACGHRSVPTLLIGGDLDFATPPQIATRELLPHLPNGHQVVLPGLGHTDDFWSDQPAASSSPRQHLPRQRDGRRLPLPARHGRLHPRRSRRRRSPRSSSPRWSAFGALAVLSLLWLARRVHKRGAIGRKAGATLRSVYVLVLGLGGWFLGALLVLTTLPDGPARRASCWPASRSACRSGSGSTGPGCTATGRRGRRRRASWPRSQARSSAPGSASTPRPASSRSSPRSSARRSAGT